MSRSGQMDLDIVQEKAIARIAAAIPQATVKLCPDNPLDLGTPTGSFQIFVGIQSVDSSEFRSGNVTHPSRQEITARLQIWISKKNIRSGAGIFAIASCITDSLSGWIPPTAQFGFFKTREEFLGLDQGQWLYSMVFSIRGFYFRRQLTEG